MTLEEHKKNFMYIIKKYNLDEPKKAEEISKYLTQGKINNISISSFAEKFGLEKYEAEIFLSFIYKGIEFKEEYIDKK